MEEKGILENILSTTEKLINGITSFGKKDISEKLESLAEILRQIPLVKRSLNSNEAEALLKIFVAVAKPTFAKQFMDEIDKEVYFNFGKYLNEQLNNPTKAVVSITHEYLNLFSFKLIRHLKLLFLQQR